MSEDLVQLSVATVNAISALKIKRGRFVSTRDGVEIHQPGKPRLLLTHGAIRDFAAESEE